jgi:cytochrome c peroxidase
MNARSNTLGLILVILIFSSLSFRKIENRLEYVAMYHETLKDFTEKQARLIELIRSSNFSTQTKREDIKKQINTLRLSLKGADFWLRYLEPLAYKKINGPLPVEWETEVFEKFEKPYKREGAGLTLATLYLDEDKASKDSLIKLISQAQTASETYLTDSITAQLNDYHHFFLCNRLHLLNLAAIYTTGFECPIPERTN